MHTAAPISAKVRTVLRWVEWGLMAHTVVANFLSPDFSRSPAGYGQLFVFLVVIGALSWRLPTERSLTYRRLYVAAGMSLLLLSNIAQLENSELFSFTIIKACLLLPRVDVILSTAIFCSLRLGYFSQMLPTLIEEAKANMQDAQRYLNPQRIRLEAFLDITVTSTFIVLMGFIFAAEQRSRRRAQVLASKVEKLATQLERSRIARDIHDSLGHSLTTLDVQLALADRYHHEGINEGSRHKLQQAIATSQQLAAQCLTEARQSLRTIHEANFDLEAALLTLSEQMHSSLAVNLNVKLNVKASPLPQQLSYQLYLICKEGLANVQKHANATKAMLSVVHTKDKIVLTIEDNGSGFEVGKVTTGYGLQGMKERSQLLGGQLTVDSAPGQGTQLQLTVPLQQTLHRAQSKS